MNLTIKNMVCNRCVMVVQQQLQAASIPFNSIVLGTITLQQQISEEQLADLREKLASVGFELMDDQKAAIVTKIKSTIIGMIHHNEMAEANKKLSALLAEKMNMDYNYLSSLFSSVEGTTIEKFVIAQRIEKVKELLVYNEMNINEIAFELGYSSVQHLSQQFKKITGLTPSQFKQLDQPQRRPLDQV